MPQASHELRAKWPGGDEEACNHLKAQGYRLRDNWTWILPPDPYQATERDLSAINYLIDEWDFGGISPAGTLPGETFR